MKGLREYFEKHPAQRQFMQFTLFSFFAMLAQVLSRLLFDVCFKGLSATVAIWPFDRQAIGSLLAFLLSNVIAKVVSYVTNRKTTFAANNNAARSAVIYAVMVTVLIIVETIIGTPLQNRLYTLLGGGFAGAELTTAAAAAPALYQLCGTLSQLLYSAADGIIVFFMDKYVIMTRSEGGA